MLNVPSVSRLNYHRQALEPILRPVPLLSVLPPRRLLLHAVRADAAVEDAETAFITSASGLDEGRGQQSWKAEAEVEEAPKVEEKTRCVVTQDLILK